MRTFIMEDTHMGSYPALEQGDDFLTLAQKKLVLKCIGGAAFLGALASLVARFYL